MTKGKIQGIISNLLRIQVDGPVKQNEICYVKNSDADLMTEVIKVDGDIAFAQVFESTRGLKIGTDVEFTGRMLEVTLGPGMLSRNYDGLQNDLDKMDGIFLKRGQYTFPLPEEGRYTFTPIAKPGDEVTGGDWLGSVKEGWIDHKIMVPFVFEEYGTIESLTGAGEYGINDEIATIKKKDGSTFKVTMIQKWAVKVAAKNYRQKPRPSRLLETGVRIIDTLAPMLEGGTGFIPGPFGCGKTVLQHAISKNADADLIIIAACGERANEVVEIFTEFPKLIDTRTGRKLIERTIIICNTSNMPVASREASVYTAMSIGEYYRAMGLKVLLLADSTSRWAQALREMSNRLEELPGPDAFPMDLPAIVANFYSRAGYVVLNNGETGSITFIGTVSPAGGNLKEPVTESTKKVARCFYALSQTRADSKRYPAVDPLDSYSKYLEYPEAQEFMTQNIGPDWVTNVNKALDKLRRGKEMYDQINILGDDSVPLNYHIEYWKSEVLDFIILQQDAFDEVDMNTPVKRQKWLLEKVLYITDTDFEFDNFEDVGPYFKRIISVMKQINYSEFQADDFKNHEAELDNIVIERRR